MSDFYTNVSCIGNNIFYKGVKNGKKIKTKIPYKPSLYVVSNKKTPFKNLEGHSLEEMPFDSIRDARDFVDQYKEIENFKIFGNNRYEYDFISKSFPSIIEWNRDDIHVVNIDIEVGSENGFPNPDIASEPITAIACKFSQSKEYFILGCGEYEKHRDDVIYTRCNDEYHLIEKFLQLWAEKSPDIITGWNVKTFDMPYLVNRITRLFDASKAKSLSPWGMISERTTTVMTREIKFYEFVGISILDYLEMYRKFNTNGTAESFRLDHIANVELGERKLSYSEYDSLHQLYRLDYQKFIEYNQKDVELVERLDEKLKLIDLALTLAYDSKTNYPDVFMQVRMWTEIIQNHLREKNIFLEIKKRDVNRSAFEGAFVKDPIVGMHEYVASFDLTSLYPSLIMMYNISPDTIVDASKYSTAMRQCSVNVEKLLEQTIDTSFLKKENVCVTPNNQFFSVQKKGFLAEIMESMFIDRQKYKKEMLSAQKEYEKIKSSPGLEKEKKELVNRISRFNNLQIAKKVSLNSGYGAIGSPYFFLFDVRQAEGITSSGQLSIRWIERKINEYMNKVLKTKDKDYVIASDTDSIYLNMSGLVNTVYKDKNVDVATKIKFMDKVCNDKIQPFIDSAYDELGEYVNCFSQKMIMKREALADKGIWIAKKRYILNVYNNEGVQYDKPKLKIMGIEAVKSSTPASCRTKIIEALNLILRASESDLQQFIEEYKDEFRNLPVEDISFPRSVNGVKQYFDEKNIFKKGTPIHVRGSLIFNHSLNKFNLEKKYQKIREGEKIKFVYLKEPNKLGTNVISFLNSLPKEFQLEKYVDYDCQFDKAFVEPLKLILEKINWSVEKVNTLESFFA